MLDEMVASLRLLANLFTDPGVGIAEASLSRILESFFTTRLGSSGSGLGLYIVYNLVTGILGGTIKAYSPPNQGLVFTLTLPRCVASQPALEIPHDR